MKKTILIAAICFAGFFKSQTWKKIDKVDFDSKSISVQSKISNYQSFELNLDQLKSDLAKVPNQFSNTTAKSSEYATSIELPNAEGKIITYKIKESSNFEQELQLKFPDIRSFVGYDVNNPNNTIRLDISPNDFHALAYTEKGTLVIDPSNSKRNHYITYLKSDVSKSEFKCHTKDSVKDVPKNNLNANNKGFNDSRLRSYRFALATTGEFSVNCLTGNETSDTQRKANVLAKLNTMMNRLNLLYEKDFSIHFNLVNNITSIIYLNAATDPWNTNFFETTQTVVDTQIGNSNYDIGHVVHDNNEPVGDGMGTLRSVCNPSTKATAYSMHDFPTTDIFVIDYFAHEIGHQFGANHTFTFRNESGVNQTEPGSGSTIMGYAGITGNTDVQLHSDDYFHGLNLEQVFDFVSSTATCSANTNTNNTAPTVNGGNDYTLPKSTPFALTAVGNDTAGQNLTYAWEQIDTGTNSVTYPKTTNATGPNFRTYNPTSSPIRVFPKLENILDGTNENTWEKLPSVSKTTNFLVSARDNRLGGGATQNDRVVLTFSALAGPFKVTNTASTWAAGTLQTILWNVANTNAAPINTQNVKISLSVDGGFTFPTVLSESTPNDGTEKLILPSNIASTTNARIKVEAVGNIYFDINDANITITPSACTANTPEDAIASNITSTSAVLNWESVANAYYKLTYKKATDVNWTTIDNYTSTSYQLANLSANTQYQFKLNSVCISGTSSTSTPEISFTTLATNPVCNNTIPTGLTSTDVIATRATLSWTSIPNATYNLQYKKSADLAWTNVNGLVNNTYTIGGLVESTSYQYRLNSVCGVGTASSYSSTYGFSTIALDPSCTPSVPSGLTSTNITANSAKLNWTLASGVKYKVQYKATNETIWKSVFVNTNSVVITNISATTAYQYKVKSLCLNAAMSNYSTLGNFSTLDGSGATCFDNYEPNNTIATAVALPINSSIQSQFSASNNNDDVYKITTTSAAPKLKIQLTNLAADYDISLMNASGSTLASSSQSNTTAESMVYNTPTTAGTYYIKVINYSGASSSSCYTLSTSTSANNQVVRSEFIEEAKVDETIKVVPNPAKDFVTITGNKVDKVIFNDMSGRNVLEIKKSNEINISALPNGVYILNIQTAKGEISQHKLLIKK